MHRFKISTADGDTLKEPNGKWFTNAFGGFVMQPMVAKIAKYVQDAAGPGEQSFHQRVGKLDHLAEPSCQEVVCFSGSLY